MPQINELTTRTFDGDSLIGFDVENTDPQTQAQYPYVTGKADGNALADFIANEQEYVTDLNTVDKHINGAINELHAINGYSYDAYDDTATYAVGDLCIYNNVLYKALQATTGNLPTNTMYWEQTSIATALSEKSNIINTLWGTSCETPFSKHSQFLVIEASSGLYTVWFASTNQINVKEWTNNSVASGNDTVTLSNLTFERINKSGVTNKYKLRVSSDSSTAFTVIN